MGKTEKGAVWLNPERTSPYEYYQYWNQHGRSDVGGSWAFSPYLAMEQVEEYGRLEGAEIKKGQGRCWPSRATKIVHGQGEAEKARKTRRGRFFSKQEAWP